jgi:hypothetical protein
MFEEKEEKLSINYRDYSPVVINYILQGAASKVIGFLNRYSSSQAEYMKKPYSFKIAMKELTSVDFE